MGYHTYVGYQDYQEVITTKSMEERVKELQSKDTYVKLNEVNKTFTDQLVASEDKRFYHHGAFDIIGLTRAVVVNITTFSFKEGGSTITQQLSKNLFFDYHRNLRRKFAEVFGAIDLENHYSKDEILEMYMNKIYYGNGCYGIKEASNYYYQKEPIDLNKEEAAALVYTIKSPNNYNPKVRKTANFGFFLFFC